MRTMQVKNKKQNKTEPPESNSNNVGLGLVFGSAVGVIVGSITGNIGLWIAIGTALGICFGGAFSKTKDSEEVDARFDDQ